MKRTPCYAARQHIANKHDDDERNHKGRAPQPRLPGTAVLFVIINGPYKFVRKHQAEHQQTRDDVGFVYVQQKVVEGVQRRFVEMKQQAVKPNYRRQADKPAVNMPRRQPVGTGYLYGIKRKQVAAKQSEADFPKRKHIIIILYLLCPQHKEHLLKQRIGTDQ